MTKWQTSGASCAYTLDSGQHLAKSITLDVSAGNETMRLSSAFVQSITEATRVFTGLVQKGLKSGTGLTSNSYWN
jgi:hypothetical protein